MTTKEDPQGDAAHPCPSLGQVFTFCIARNQGLRASVVSTAPNDQSPLTGPQKLGELGMYWAWPLVQILLNMWFSMLLDSSQCWE